MPFLLSLRMEIAHLTLWNMMQREFVIPLKEVIQLLCPPSPRFGILTLRKMYVEHQKMLHSKC